jgi:spore germination protein GerM
MKKRYSLLIIVTALLISTLSLSGCQKTVTTPKDNQAGASKEDPKTISKQTISLYFSDDQAMFLLPEKREIQLANNATQEQLIEATVKQLIEGPKTKELQPTFPPETRLLGVKVENGTAIVDFSSELRSKHWGGSAGESMTLGSLVNTLTEIKGIDKVQLLLEGKKVESLLGHMDTSVPLTRDESMIK